ncbi:hypothetical protein [Xanthomonas sp. 60]
MLAQLPRADAGTFQPAAQALQFRGLLLVLGLQQRSATLGCGELARQLPGRSVGLGNLLCQFTDARGGGLVLLTGGLRGLGLLAERGNVALAGLQALQRLAL